MIDSTSNQSFFLDMATTGRNLQIHLLKSVLGLAISLPARSPTHLLAKIATEPPHVFVDDVLILAS